MKPDKKNTGIFIILFFVAFGSRAQLYVKLGPLRNQFFIGSGYSESFSNISYGINHTRYFKRLKRTIVGIIDFNSPVYYKDYTRFVFRKGFQFDLFQLKSFKMPLALISSTVKKNMHLFSFHDVISSLFLLPGIYTDRYTLAAECAIDVLWFHKTNYSDAYYRQSGVPAKPMEEKVRIRTGVVLAYNFYRFSLLFKGGYQQVTHWEYLRNPYYFTATFGFNLNFRKNKKTDSNTNIKS